MCNSMFNHIDKSVIIIEEICHAEKNFVNLIKNAVNISYICPKE